jgi:hypothetical protein
MVSSREDAEDLAQQLIAVRAENSEGTYWEVAAARTGISGRDLRVIRDDPTHAFLLDEAWVIELTEDGGNVREWGGASDPLYDSAEKLDAFEDLS